MADIPNGTVTFLFTDIEDSIDHRRALSGRAVPLGEQQPAVMPPALARPCSLDLGSSRR